MKQDVPFAVGSDKTVEALKAAWRRPLLARIAELETLLKQITDLALVAPPGAFNNGVTDSTGTIDEGDVRAGQIIDEALRAVRQGDAITAALHSQYPIETDYDRGYAAGRRDAAKAIRDRIGEDYRA